jgi:hypothetical protein
MSCGGTSPKPDPSRLARVVATTDSLCRRGSPVRQGQLDIVERAAEYLPAGQAFKKAHAERRALEPKLLRAFNEVASGDASQRSTAGLVDRFYRLQMHIYDSLKALGLGPCLGPPPHRIIVG